MLKNDKILELTARVHELELQRMYDYQKIKLLEKKVKEYGRFTDQLILVHGDLDAGIKRYKAFRKLDWSRLAANCKQMERVARQTIDFIEGEQ